MTSPPRNIALCIIVKNERPNIARLWESVRRHVDMWVVVDTGSTDGTQDAVREVFDKPGLLVERPWTDFATARTESLSVARHLLPAERGVKPEWFLVMDADETLEFGDETDWPDLTPDVTALCLRGRRATDDVTWARQHLLRSDKPWRYEGVLHEYPVHDGEQGISELTDVPYVLCHDDGVRTRSWSDLQQKFARDRDVLLAYVTEHPEAVREWFYLGQSCKGTLDWQGALLAFAKRAETDDGSEECYMAVYMAGVILLDQGSSEAKAWLTRAWKMRKWRAEPLVALAALLRKAGDVCEAYLMAQRAVWMNRPEGEIFFMSDHFWNWARTDELAVCAFKVAKVDEGIALSEELLKRTDLPDEHRARIEKNLSEGRRWKMQQEKAA